MNDTVYKKDPLSGPIDNWGIANAQCVFSKEHGEYVMPVGETAGLEKNWRSGPHNICGEPNDRPS